MKFIWTGIHYGKTIIKLMILFGLKKVGFIYKKDIFNRFQVNIRIFAVNI